MKNKEKLCCENCEDCVYICEGDFLCISNDFDEPAIVFEDFSIPTADYMRCKKIKGENKNEKAN